MSREILIFAEGKQKEIIYEGVEHLAIPVACDDGYCMGIGLKFVDNDRGRIYSLSPRKILTAYRAMRVADLIREFTATTLHNCWIVADSWPDYCDIPIDTSTYTQNAFEEIKKRARVCQEELKQIIHAVPENIEQILGISKDKWEFDGFKEIEGEIRAGKIQLTPTIEDYFMQFQRYKLGK